MQYLCSCTSQIILGIEQNEPTKYKQVICVLYVYSTVASKMTVGKKYWKSSFLFQACGIFSFFFSIMTVTGETYI